MENLTTTQTAKTPEHTGQTSMLEQLLENQERLIYLLSCDFPLDLEISLQ
jgi:hypothetical protein